MALRYRFRGSSDQGRDAATDVKSWVREILDLTDDTVVSIASHSCGGVDCGDAAAIILLPRPGYSTRSIRLSKQLNTVTKADLRAALQPVLGELAHEAGPLRTAITD
jgi:hypothetical protein